MPQLVGVPHLGGGTISEAAIDAKIASAVAADPTVAAAAAAAVDANPTIATHTAAIARTDPGVAGAERQTLRIRGGVPRWVDSPTFLARDYVTGTLAEDASPGLAALISASQGPINSGVTGANIEFGPGEYRLTQTLDLTRFSGRIAGAGRGNSPYYAPNPGNATVFRWDGPADQPMFRVRDSQDIILENFRMEGKVGVLASYGIEFLSTSGEGAGTNQFIRVQDVHIGKYAWTSQGIWKGNIKSGIGFTGANENNDQFRIDNVFVSGATKYGLYIQNSQSVGGTARNLVVDGAGIAGVSTAASLHLVDPEFYFCSVDVETTEFNANLRVTNIYSEDSKMIARVHAYSGMEFAGGNVRVDDVISNGGVMIDAYPSGSMTLILDGLYVSANTNPALARIEIGPSATGSVVGRFLVRVSGCRGMRPDQIVLAAGSSFWAGSPISQGIIEWQSAFGDNAYQFRNELRYQGRTEIDPAIYDFPITATGPLRHAMTGVLGLRPMATAPAIGRVGDLYMTSVGKLMVCTVAGTPGTWVAVGTQT